MKKILFYLEPWLEMAYKDDNYRINYFKQFIQIALANLKNDFEIHVLLSDFHYSLLSQDVKNNCHFYIIEQAKLTDIFQSYDNYINRKMENSDLYIEYLKSLNLVDDISLVYSVSSDCYYLNAIYDKVPKLFLESGIINGYQNITPRLYLDPNICDHGGSFLDIEYDNLTKYLPEENELTGVKEIARLLTNGNKVFVDELRKKYNKVYLFVIENFDSYFKRLYHEKENFLDYILDVVSKISKDSVVILTEHKRYRFITNGIIDYLTCIGINAIFDKNIKSNDVLPYVDGVIGCFSTLLLNAMILQKPLFITSKKSYLIKYSDAENIDDFVNFVENDNPANSKKLSAICFLLGRYYIPDSFKLNANYLNEIINYYSKHGIIDFNFYKMQNISPIFIKVCKNSFIMKCIRRIGKIYLTFHK